MVIGTLAFKPGEGSLCGTGFHTRISFSPRALYLETQEELVEVDRNLEDAQVLGIGAGVHVVVHDVEHHGRQDHEERAGDPLGPRELGAPVARNHVEPGVAGEEVALQTPPVGNAGIQIPIKAEM